MEIRAPDGTILYAGNGKRTIDFTVNIPENGAYPVTVEAQGAKGTIHIQTFGGKISMNAIYEHKPEMTLIGFSTTIRPDEGYTKCPEFWDKEYAQKYSRLWHTMQPETPIEKALLENQIGMFAICNEKDDCFEYWIAGLYRGGKVPEGLKLYTFPESEWAVFSAKGALPDSLQRLNTAVWQEWYPNEGKQYISGGNSMLEVYSAGDMQSPDYECAIWVPVVKK